MSFSASVDVISLYTSDGALLPASYAGIDFWIVDSRDEAGRRVQRFLFPAQDQVDFQDLGQANDEIHISGIYVGDDYTDVAQQLRAAFRSPGPQTLDHPWLGEITVIQSPGKLLEISFKQDELRVLRFTASFCLYDPPDPPALDTYADLEDAVDYMQAQAAVLLGAVLAPVAVTIAAIGYVISYAATMVATWNVLVGNTQQPQVAQAASAPIAALSTVNDIAADVNYPVNVASVLGAVSSAIADTSTPVMPAAVAPGGPTTIAPAVDGRVTANLILAAVTTMAAKSTDPPPGPTIAAVAQMLALGDAITAVASITFTSQQEASLWLATMQTALGLAATQAALLAASQPVAAGAAWRSIIAAQAALSADMTATIGRLPSVTTFTAPSSVPVWLLAHYLVGDRPDLVLATYLDIVNRNGIEDPSAAPAGPLEVLLR